MFLVVFIEPHKTYSMLDPCAYEWLSAQTTIKECQLIWLTIFYNIWLLSNSLYFVSAIIQQYLLCLWQIIVKYNLYYDINLDKASAASLHSNMKMKVIQSKCMENAG